MITKFHNAINIITDYFTKFGPLGGLLLIIINSIYPIAVPLGVYMAFNVSAFGLLFGIIISYVGTIIGCIISFILFKKFDTRFFKKFNEREKVKKIKGKMNNITIPSLATITAMPFFPAYLINIAAGLSRVDNKKFIVGICIGKIPLVLFWCLIGKSFMDSVTDYKTLIILVLMLVLTYVISKVLTKVFKWEV